MNTLIYNTKKTYLFELLERDILNRDIDVIKIFKNNNSKKYRKTINLSKRLSEIIKNQEYKNTSSLLNQLNFNINEFIIILTNDIPECLRHTDELFDRVLHQTKVAVFENSTFLPICYIEKSIKDSENQQNENSYIKEYVYDVLKDFDKVNFDRSIVSIYKNHIGSYIVLFNHKNEWHFLSSNNIYKLTKDTHSILFDHVSESLYKLDINYCYHIIIVDMRLHKLITPVTDKNYIILIKITEKYTLKQIDNNLFNNIFVEDKEIYISCMDELRVRIEEFDLKNIRLKKLLNRGFIMKIKIDDCDEIHINYDTPTYKHVISMIPNGLCLHGVHLKLYQNYKLNYFLQFFNDSYIFIVKRINESINTMCREILDIYHMTRKKKNSFIYNLLPVSYKQVIYHLHTDYIEQKNNGLTEVNDILDNNLEDNNYKIDEKISITIDDVYLKLKDLDISLLIDLYKDREKLNKDIEELIISNPNIKNPLKDCINTTLQTKFLNLNRHI